MGNDDSVYRDITDYSGVSFWAKASSDVTTLSVRFVYKNYTGRYGETPREYILGSEASSPLQCIPSLNTNWQIYVIPFSKFTIPSWIPNDPKYGGEDEEGNQLFDPLATADKWDKIKALLFQTGKSVPHYADKVTVRLTSNHMIYPSLSNPK